MFRPTCGDLSLCAFIFRTQGCGCAKHPAFPAPSVCWRDVWKKARADHAAAMRTLVAFGCLKIESVSRAGGGDHRAPLAGRGRAEGAGEGAFERARPRDMLLTHPLSPQSGERGWKPHVLRSRWAAGDFMIWLLHYRSRGCAARQEPYIPGALSIL